MDHDKVNAKIQAAINSSPQGDGGPAWLPVTGTLEDVAPHQTGTVKFGPVTLEIKGSTEDEVANAKTILGIFGGALAGRPFSIETAMNVVSGK